MEPVVVSAEERMRVRSDALVRTSLAAREQLLSCKEDIARENTDLQQELAALRAELAHADVACRELASHLTHVVTNMRGAIKNADVARVQSRIDAWAPERKISRKALRALLDDSFSS